VKNWRRLIYGRQYGDEHGGFGLLVQLCVVVVHMEYAPADSASEECFYGLPISYYHDLPTYCLLIAMNMLSVCSLFYAFVLLRVF
jgi:hypothetical protein